MPGEVEQVCGGLSAGLERSVGEEDRGKKISHG